MSLFSISRVLFTSGLLVLGLLGGCSGGASPRAELVWTDEAGYRWAPLDVRERGGAGFEAVDSTRSGVGFVNTLSQQAFLSNRHYVNGSGVAVGDVNGDDWPDLFLARLEGPNALYLNAGASGGGFRFTAVPEAGGAALAGEFSTGAALEDLDGDGNLDLIVTTMGGPNAAYRGDGTGRFTRYEAGLHAGEGSTTVALADIDTDGDLDLYVSNYKRLALRDSLPPDQIAWDQIVKQTGEQEYEIAPAFRDEYTLEIIGTKLLRLEKAEPDRLYRNDGTGRFTAVSMTGGAFRTASGEALEEAPADWALVARFQDMNGDGAADLYVCNDFESPDHVWLGDGQGGFQAIDPLAVRKTSHSTMSVDFSDINRDGHVDFFLADMLARSYTDRQAQVGMQDPMPEAVGEIDNRPQEMQNTLFVNRGDGTWAEIAEMAGVEASGWTWSSLFLDADLDGYEDLLLTNGHHYNAMDADTQTRQANMGYTATRDWRRSLLEFPDLDLHNAAYRNRGDGTFEAVASGWGLGRETDVAHGMATGDFDRDGDLDVVISRLNGPVGLFRNAASAPRVAVRLRGPSGNVEGIGATVRVEPLAGEASAGEVVPAQMKEVVAGGQYLSDSAAQVAFAVGAADSVRIAVRWPGGARSVVVGGVNRLYEIYAPSAGPSNEVAQTPLNATTPRAQQPASPVQRAALRPAGQASQSTEADSTLFQDVSDRLGHEHAEERYGDFQRQPLLSRRLSQQGPAAAWADVDGDGDDDLLIGSGRGGALAMYRNDGAGRFQPVTGGPMDSTVERDLTGIVVLPRSDDGAWVFVGRSNYERRPDEPARNSQVLMYDVDATGMRRVAELDAGPASVGPLALSDVDGDGDVDLIAGGRHVPSRYPESASSRIFVNEGDGQFTYSARLSRPLQQVGMVSGMAAADFDADGDQDLVLAMEWGPVAYFENQGRGRLTDRTEARGLDRYTGLWNGVAAGDFDGDGRPDLVATNWGWNSKYGRPPGRLADIDTPFLPRPLRVYYADFDRNGIMDVIETKYYGERGAYLPFENLSSIAFALPYVRQRMRSFDQFAQSSLDEIFGPQRMQAASHKEAATLSNMVFLNREAGDGITFEGRNLPAEAQYAPAFAPTVGDFDGDGQEDIVLSQNFFAVEIETPRQDAGRALLLRGRGDGSFDSVPGQESGLTVYGEQRAAPASDLDGDGRLDMLVTQNGAPTTLYRNIGGAPGLRVQLDGPSSNPAGLGATVRLVDADGSRGPARVIAAGSGYWSQHTLTAVMGRGGRTVAAVAVRWPDGTTSRATVSSESATVTVSHASGTASK